MQNSQHSEYFSWIRKQRHNPNPKLRLFCFPYAGGGASLFRLWQENLSTEVDVCPVQLPGRESRIKELPYDNLYLLIEKLFEVMYPALNTPFVFLGYSLGGLISFELSRLLRRKVGILPDHLIIAACPAPHVPDLHSPVHQLPRSEFIESLKEMEGTPTEVFNDPGLLDFFIPLLRADFKIYETYHYSPDLPLACPISVYGGLGDESVPVDSLQSWQEQTTSSFKRRMFPGNHYFIRDNTHTLFQAILDDLSTVFY